METVDWLQLFLFCALLLILVRPCGLYLYRVLEGERTCFDRLLRPIELALYRFASISTEEQGVKAYLRSLLTFTGIALASAILLLALQGHLGLNPERLPAPSWHLILNTAISFTTNTDWQSYGGETTMSYFSQMVVLALHNFTSAAVGLSVAAALTRGIARRAAGTALSTSSASATRGASGSACAAEAIAGSPPAEAAGAVGGGSVAGRKVVQEGRKAAGTIGNFWVDLVRIHLYILLPGALLFAVFFLSEGVPQNFSPYVRAATLSGGEQLIAQGPVASQEAIKLLGSNGGGFMNVNAAHPYENPSPLCNVLQWIAILLIPAAQIDYFGRAVGRPRHAWCLLAALMLFLVVDVIVCASCEAAGNGAWRELGLYGGNWEGKELRFGLFGSSLYASITTLVSCGSNNCMHDSLTPLGGMIPMLNIQMSEVIFGGVGVGLCSILFFVLLSVFISGLIIGRTPEYLGKKIEAYDVKMTVFALLSFVALVHVLTACACSSSWGVSALGNGGPHGFSEMLYAFSSCAANNGSAFGGLTTSTPLYDLLLGLAMLLGRFVVLIPSIALAGSFSGKKVHPLSAGSFPVSSPLFIALFVGVVLLLGLLTFLPALSLGPILEQFFMMKGHLFAGTS